MEWPILIILLVIALYWFIQWSDWKTSNPDNLTFKEWRKQQEERSFDTYF